MKIYLSLLVQPKLGLLELELEHISAVLDLEFDLFCTLCTD